MRPDRGLALAGQPRQPGIGEALRLEFEQPGALVRQAALADLLLGRDQVADLLEKPGIVLADALDLLDVEAEPESLGDHPQPVGGRPRQRRQHAIARPVGVREPLDLDLVQALEVGLQGAQRLLQRFLKRPADRHHLADRFHRGGERRVGLGKFFEGEAGNLGDHVVDARLERGRRAPGDIVGDLVQRVADREPGGDLGDREARGLRGERRRARHAGIHLDDHQPAVVGTDRELHVRAAGIDPDLAQHRDRGVAHALVFLVGQRQRRCDGDAVAGVHAHRVDVLDRADDDAVVRAVADHLHLVLLPAGHGFLDQDLADRRGVEAAGGQLVELRAIVGDAAAGAAERVARPDHRRQADLGERRLRLGERAGDGAARQLEADLGHRGAKQLAVLGLGDRLDAGADQLHAMAREGAVLGQGAGQVEGGLAAHRRQAGIRPLALDDAREDVRQQRLDVGRIRQIRVGHDRGRIGVDQDHPVALGLERLDGLRARIVELAGLADHDRSRSDHQDGADVGAFGHQPRSISARNRWNR